MAEDRRVRKTKRLLREGLAALLQVKSINRITVRELAEYADINRATFYAHYCDVYDLMQQTQVEVSDDIRSILQGYKLEGEGFDLPAFFGELLQYLAENAGLAQALLCTHGDMLFVQSIQQLIGDYFTKYWKNDEFHFWHYSRAFLVAGSTGLIQQWLADGMPETPQQMAGIMVELISSGLAKRDILPETV